MRGWGRWVARGVGVFGRGTEPMVAPHSEGVADRWGGSVVEGHVGDDAESEGSGGEAGGGA